MNSIMNMSNIIPTYNIPYKLTNWINQDEIEWKYEAIHLLENPDEISLDSGYEAIEKNPVEIDWKYLTWNSTAIHFLEQNFDEISLSSGYEAIYLNPVEIDWNSAAIHIEQNLDKIHWKLLSENPTVIHLIEQKLIKFIENFYKFLLPSIFSKKTLIKLFRNIYQKMISILNKTS